VSAVTAVEKAPPGRPAGNSAAAATRGPGGQGAGSSVANPSTAAPPRPKPVALVPMRRDAAKLMRGLAASVQKSHPGMNVHDHLRDAAKTLEAGNEEGAQRHLRAAFFSLTPQSLHRHGLFTDDAHTGARQAMHAVHRHIMLVKDIADADARNQAAIRRDSGDGAAVPQGQPGPNAGYGPGALAQKPGTASGLSAPAKADGGGSDPSVADPDAPQKPGSRQFSYDWDDILRVIDLVGPHGFEHNWVFVGIPSAGQKVTFGTGRHATGTVSHADATHVHVRMGDGSVVRVPHNGKPGPGKLTPAGHGGSPEAAAARKAAGNVRFERGLTRGQKEEGEQRLYKAASHLDAGNHGEAASELDAAMHATSLRGGAVIKGSTAAQARDLRDKVSAGHPAAPAAAGAVPDRGPADKLTMATNPGAAAKGMSDGDLKSADQEFASRAAMLGKPGQVSKAHRAVRDEIGARAGFQVAKVGKSWHLQEKGAGRAGFPTRQGAQQAMDNVVAQRARFAQAEQDEQERTAGILAGKGIGKIDYRNLKPGDKFATSPLAPVQTVTAVNHMPNGNSMIYWEEKGPHVPRNQPTQFAMMMPSMPAYGTTAKAKGATVKTAYDQGDLAAIDLVGPGGFQHGWKPGGPTAADHDKAAKLHTQAAAKAKDPAARAAHLRRAKVHAQVAKKLRSLSPAKPVTSASLAYGWDDLSAAIEFSAKTAALEQTPALYGKPGGPGLYGVAGNKHSDYFEQVVKGLMTKRGMGKGQASAIAWGVLRKWAHGGGGVHPEVAAAASRALAQEAAASAKAHAHANDSGAVELVGPKGYIHGWIYVGGAGLPSVASHNAKLKARGITPPTRAHPALTREPPAPKAKAAAPKAAPVKSAPAVKAPQKAAPAAPAPGGKSVVPQAKLAAKAAGAASAEAPQEPKLSAKEKKRLTDMWTSSYRYSGTSFYAGSDRSKVAEGQKRGQEFAGELHRLLATNKPPAQCGPGCRDAHKFLAMVDSDSTAQHEEMQRGIDLPSADARRLFRPGKDVDLPAASWTTSPDVSRQYAGSEASAGKARIVLHAPPPAKGLGLQGISQSGITASEAEVVTGGRYSVDSVKTTGGVMHVYLTQKDFSAH
jgi:hypothetical protein